MIRAQFFQKLSGGASASGFHVLICFTTPSTVSL
jgi:hypothetical protein